MIFVIGMVLEKIFLNLVDDEVSIKRKNFSGDTLMESLCFMYGLAMTCLCSFFAKIK